MCNIVKYLFALPIEKNNICTTNFGQTLNIKSNYVSKYD